MSIHVALNHVTHYRYDRPITLSPQVIRLRPAPHSRTPILSYSLKVTPAEHFINWQQDPQANYLARLVFPEKTSEFRIEVDLTAEMSVINPFDFFLEPYADNFPFEYEPWQLHELAPYLVKLPLNEKNAPRFARYVESIPRSPKQSVDFLVELNQRLQHDIQYLIRLEPGVQTPEETLEKASGSCRDSGWLLVQILRHIGLAARFVSGYLIQLKADVKSLDGPSGTEVDFTDLHAWCEVYLPGAGWIGLDPTSGLFAGEGHIPLACTPEPGSASPVTGFTEKCECEFEHQMKIERVWEAPRVTKPYTDEQWEEIESLGHRIDADLVGSRRAADHGWRADLRFGGRSRWCRMEHRRHGRADQAPARRRPAGQAQGALCASGPAALRPGQVVSRRAVAALVAHLLLAQGWRSDLAGPGAVRRRACRLPRHARRRRQLPAPAGRQTRSRCVSTCRMPTRTPGTTCGASAACRSTSTRSMPNSTIRSSGRVSPRYSVRVSTIVSVTCCRSRATSMAGRSGKAARGSCAASACT